MPIIVLSARAGETDKIEALDAGADDYLTKPFGVGELLARVRAALRRRLAAGAGKPSVRIGDVEVDLTARTVRKRGEAIHLTPIEYRLLTLLISSAGRVLTHRAILQEVWGPEYGGETQYLRVYASQLRKKLGDDPTRPRLVTEPGIGYRLVDPD